MGDICREFNPESTRGERATVDSIRSRERKKKSASPYQEEAGRSRSHPEASAAAAAHRSGTNPRRSRGSRARADPIARAPDRRTRRKNSGRGKTPATENPQCDLVVAGEEMGRLGPWKRGKGKRTGTAPRNSVIYCRFLVLRHCLNEGSKVYVSHLV